MFKKLAILSSVLLSTSLLHAVGVIPVQGSGCLLNVTSTIKCEFEKSVVTMEYSDPEISGGGLNGTCLYFGSLIGNAYQNHFYDVKLTVDDEHFARLYKSSLNSNKHEARFCSTRRTSSSDDCRGDVQLQIVGIQDTRILHLIESKGRQSLVKDLTGKYGKKGDVVFCPVTIDTVILD